MSDMLNQKYLRDQQYHTATNLNARIALHERFSTNPTDWHHWVFQHFAFPEQSRILELGSGSGALWLKNSALISSSWKITLSDFSSGMLDAARSALGTQDERFQFEVIDAQSIPFPDHSFDYVIANHMLYHVPDRARAFAEIKRVLTPTGKLYAATNGEHHLREIKALCSQAGVTALGVLSGIEGSSFTLENGPAQMQPFFSQVDLQTFPGGLSVTEAQPLLNFILSALPSLTPAQLDRLRVNIEQALSTGPIYITKETGIFLANN